MTPLELAVLFHKTYERLAPSFGYETRTETRAFDPTTPNGRLMVAVCGEIQASLEARLAEEIAIVDRIWDIYGRPTYEQLAGRSIYDLIESDRARLAEEDKWRRFALLIGEQFTPIGPDGYYSMTPDQWLDWAWKHGWHGGNPPAAREGTT